MNELDLLIKTTDSLCSSLDRLSRDDKAFSFMIGSLLEKLSCDMHRAKNKMQEIKEYVS